MSATDEKPKVEMVELRMVSEELERADPAELRKQLGEEAYAAAWKKYGRLNA